MNIIQHEHRHMPSGGPGFRASVAFPGLRKCDDDSFYSRPFLIGLKGLACERLSDSCLNILSGCLALDAQLHQCYIWGQAASSPPLGAPDQARSV